MVALKWCRIPAHHCPPKLYFYPVSLGLVCEILSLGAVTDVRLDGEQSETDGSDLLESHLKLGCVFLSEAPPKTCE